MKREYSQQKPDPVYDSVIEVLDQLLPDLKAHPHRPAVEQVVRTSLRVIQKDISRLDIKILNSSVRELLHAFSIFKPYRNIRKVSMFGSARIEANNPYYKSAVRFSKLLAQKKWMIITGAASGIMQAGNEGAGRAKSFGVNILLPFEQEANAFLQGDPKLMHFRYFFTRKLIFIKESDAIALFPGGFGTLDEGFEVLTLLQTGKTTPRPIVMVDQRGGSYWTDYYRFLEKHLVKNRLINAEDLGLFKIVRSPEAAVKECLTFYSNYHSMRYLPDVAPDYVVIRLKRKPRKHLLSLINRQFDSLLSRGAIEPVQPHPDEIETEPETLKLHRIAFRFNRQSFGRLRQLIDTFNAQG